MEKVIYTIEQRKTKTEDFINADGYETLEEAKRSLDHYKDYSINSKCFKGQTMLLIKQTCLYDEDGEFVEVIEEEFLEEIEF